MEKEKIPPFEIDDVIIIYPETMSVIGCPICDYPSDYEIKHPSKIKFAVVTEVINKEYGHIKAVNITKKQLKEIVKNRSIKAYSCE